LPTKQLTLTGTAQKIVDANPLRTSLTIANTDDDIAYISDEHGPGTTSSNGYAIFASTYISLERKADEPQKAWYGVMETGKTGIITILEMFGDIDEPPQPTEPSPQDPTRRVDAPLMRRF